MHVDKVSRTPIFTQIVDVFGLKFQVQIRVEYVGKFIREYLAYDDRYDTQYYSQYIEGRMWHFE